MFKKKQGWVRVAKQKYFEMKELLAGREADNHKLQLENAARALRIVELETQLGEARRRTIPIGMHGQGGEGNFLPLYIEKMDVRHDIRRIHSLSGESAVVCGLARATIECVGDIVYFPPPK